ncbi:MAG: GNAT family N-acetyltransferase [Pirellulales bacterium]|nr:GNAT family N-acetyltransferase [Pirellulales bacterium]
MDHNLEDSTIYCFPHAFINKKGEPILIAALDDKRCEQLIAMYLAYKPRGSFQGLPPLADAACKSWVQHMIGHGINLVALSFGEGVVGHMALFPINDRVCEMLVVVCPAMQNTGIGTELVRCSIQLSDELGFERIRLSVESTNVRARHVYKKSGFEYLKYEAVGEVEMALDLTTYRSVVNVSVAGIMNANVLSIQESEPCRTAVGVFLNSHVASLPVVDEQGSLVGIISKTDLMLPSKIARKVGDILTRDVLFVREDCDIAKVIRMLQSKKVRAIPVVDRERKLVGVVGRKDILAHYAKHF